MVPTTMRARRNIKKVEKDPNRTTQQQYNKQVWLSYELVNMLANAKLPGERSLNDVATRLLMPVLNAQAKARPVNDLTRKFKSVPAAPRRPRKVVMPNEDN